MNIIRGKPVPKLGIYLGFIVIGNGIHDEKVMRTLFKRFDDKAAVLMPQARPALGLEGSIDLAAELIGRFGKDVLIVIDKEAFDESRFKSILEYKFSICSIQKRDTSFWCARVVRGVREANLYVAIMGIEKGIEEVEAILIRERYGEDIEPTKNAIRTFLRRHDTKIYDVIEELGEESIRRAFPRAFIDFLKKWSKG